MAAQPYPTSTVAPTPATGTPPNLCPTLKVAPSPAAKRWGEGFPDKVEAEDEALGGDEVEGRRGREDEAEEAGRQGRN